MYITECFRFNRTPSSIICDIGTVVGCLVSIDAFAICPGVVVVGWDVVLLHGGLAR